MTMTIKHNPANIKQVLDEKLHPTVVMWNRLEGRPRTHHFDRALKGEVRDALWMLTKQWQMGEFKADDAGSPVHAKVHITSSRLDTFKAAGQNPQDFEHNIPLEAKAEQKQIPFTRDGKEISIDIRLQLGRYWLQLLKEKGLNYKHEYINKYAFKLPEKNGFSADIYAHKEVWQQYAALSGRCMDGYKLLQYLDEKEENQASDGISNTDPDKTALDQIGQRFSVWYSGMYYQPSEGNNDAWQPERLEYEFECSAESNVDKKTLAAKEYASGHLDWYAFDLKEDAGEASGPEKETFTDTFIPSHIEFDGMPEARWWKFEDSKTDLGDIKPSTTDLSKLMLMEFGLVFANDWFLIPYTLPVGSLVKIEGLTVQNNFGETIWVESTEKESTADLPWSMFKLRSALQNNILFLAPSAMKVQESNPLEEVRFVRDEMANMVWGIETVIQTRIGKPDKGSEAALRIRKFHEDLIGKQNDQDEIPYAAEISYQAMTDVPENWIPFVPVHKNENQRSIQLQRASMLRIIEGDPSDHPEKIKPETSMLREGLDETVLRPYFIYEEEVPRSGVTVLRSYQRTRWQNGEVFTWAGMRKKSGRGEGSSGLAFDKIKDVKKGK